MRFPLLPGTFLFFFLHGLPAGPAVWAADHRNLEEGLPTQIEDAYAIPFRALEMEFSADYQRGKEGSTDTVELEPEVKWGLVKNGHVGLGVPLSLASGRDNKNQGDLKMEALYNFNVETPGIPAAAVKTRLVFPTGVNSRGTDLEVAGILTRGWGYYRFHFNGGYRKEADPEPNARKDLYFFGLGLDHPWNLDNLIVADFFVERAAAKGGDPVCKISIGVRRQVNPWSVVSMGLGTGFGESEAPDFIARLGYQMAF